MKQWK